MAIRERWLAGGKHFEPLSEERHPSLLRECETPTLFFLLYPTSFLLLYPKPQAASFFFTQPSSFFFIRNPNRVANSNPRAVAGGGGAPRASQRWAPSGPFEAASQPLERVRARNPNLLARTSNLHAVLTSPISHVSVGPLFGCRAMRRCHPTCGVSPRPHAFFSASLLLSSLESSDTQVYEPPQSPNLWQAKRGAASPPNRASDFFGEM